MATPRTSHAAKTSEDKSIRAKGQNLVQNFFANKVRAIIIIGLILIVLFFGYRQFTKSSQKPTYQTAQVQSGSITASVSTSGQILTTNIVNITTGANGTVKDVFVKNGATVNVGDNIAEITLDLSGQQQNAQAWSSYLAAKTNLDAASVTQYSLQSDMFTKWKIYMALAQNSTYQNSDGSPNTANRALPEFHVAEDDWLAAEAKYKNQQAVISQSQADVSAKWASYQLTSPTITAPIAGTIQNIMLIPGMVLSNTGTSVSVGTGGSSQSSGSNQRVAVIQNEGMPTATFNISEVDIARVKVGQSATITLDAVPAKTFAGKVASVDHIGTVTSGVTNYQILITFQTEVPEILPNMAVNANIITDTKDVILKVPTLAVQTSGGQTTVRVLQNGNVNSVPVEIGLTSDSETEITNGLSEGQTVVTGVTQPATGGQTTSPFGAFGRQGGGFGAGGAGRLQGGGR